MNGIIIYKGKYGSARQYACWASEELRLQVVDADNLEQEKLSLCDYVVISSSVYIGKLLIGTWLKQHMSLLQTKKIFLLIVCATPSSEKEKQEKIIKDNVPDALRGRCDIFFAPGSLVINKLSLMDRLMLKLGSLMEKDSIKKRAMQHDINAVKIEHITPLVNAVDSFRPGAIILRQTGLLHKVIE